MLLMQKKICLKCIITFCEFDEVRSLSSSFLQ